MTTIAIPGKVAGILRRALFIQLGEAASDIATAAAEGERTRQPRLFTDALGVLDASRALFDQIGWDQPAGRERTRTITLASQETLGDALLDGIQADEDFLTSAPRAKRRKTRRDIRRIERFLAKHKLAPRTPMRQRLERGTTALEAIDLARWLLRRAHTAVKARRAAHRVTPLGYEARQLTALRRLLESEDGLCTAEELAPDVGGLEEARTAILELRETGLADIINRFATPSLAARTLHEIHPITS